MFSKRLRKLIRREAKMGKRNGRFSTIWGNLEKSKNRFKGPRKKRNRAGERRNFAETWHARVAEAAGFNMVGDYDRRMAGLAPVGKIARFECGDTDRFKKECPVFLEKQKNSKRAPKKIRKGEWQSKRKEK